MASPATPGMALWFGPDGGPYTFVGSANPLPVSAAYASGNFIVAGPVIAGNAPSGGPVYVGGTDGTNVRALSTDVTGRVNVVLAGAGVDTAGVQQVSQEGKKASYSASFIGLTIISGDMITIAGSASKTIKITKVRLSAISTAAGSVDLSLMKRSTADTGGTSTTATAVPLDSNDATATAVVNTYTVAPTTGTVVGNIRATKLALIGTNTLAEVEYRFEGPGEKLPTLRGTAQLLAILIGGTPPAGTSLDGSIDWTEE